MWYTVDTGVVGRSHWFVECRPCDLFIERNNTRHVHQYINPFRVGFFLNFGTIIKTNCIVSNIY